MDSRLNDEARTTTAADNLTKDDEPNPPQVYKRKMPNNKKRFNANIGRDKNNSRLSAERRAEYIAEDQQIDAPNTEENPYKKMKVADCRTLLAKKDALLAGNRPLLCLLWKRKPPIDGPPCCLR